MQGLARFWLWLGLKGGSLPLSVYGARSKSVCRKNGFGRIERSEKPERRRVSQLADDSGALKCAAIRRYPLCAASTKSGVKMGLLAFMLICFTLSACSDPESFEGYFVETLKSGRVDYNVQTDGGELRYHRMVLKQYDTQLAGIIEMFNMNSYEEFDDLPNMMDYQIDYYSCVRFDEAYVSSDKLHATFTDQEMRRWRLNLSHCSGSKICGNFERLNYKSAVQNDSEACLWKDFEYCSHERSNSNMIVMENVDSSKANKLSCVDYYRDYDFYVRLTEPLAKGVFCKPSAKMCNNVRLGVFLTRLDGNTLVTSEYASARLDSFDISPNGERRVRLRRPVSLYASSLGNVAFATLVAYVDVYEDGVFDIRDDRVVAYLDKKILMFASEAAHESLKGISSATARLDEIMAIVSEQNEPMKWQIYSVTTATRKTLSVQATAITGLGSVSDVAVELESALDDTGNGCCFEMSDTCLRQCSGIFPVGVAH